MRKAKVLSNLLLAIGMIAASAVTAHAGAGSGGTLPGEVVMFDCYFIENSVDSPYQLDLTDQFGTQGNVYVGRGRLLCTPTTAAVHIRKGPVLNPDFDVNTAFHIKCYDVFAPGQVSRPVVKVTDALSTETVRLNRMIALCTPANKEVITP
jgi:hypothetical protein